MRNKPPVHVEFASPFAKAIKRLIKKYRHIGDDILPLIEQLRFGETPGEQIQNVGYPVYKVRIRSRDISKGKSGGYRVIYYVRTADWVVLLTMYPKAERTDIGSEEIRKIIELYTHSGE
jgi:mRNA-degrading endonuclease RelE of RelBE toxin-antitoxin system